MKVDKINYNLTRMKPKVQKNYNPHFSGAAISTSAVVKEINPLMPKFIQWINKLNASKGEVQDILINALGTGLIAPVFIKYNPLSKSDEDTRTYSAMRQPISAVLAVITQAGVTIPYNSWLGKKFDDGSIKGINHNRTLFQNEKYIAKLQKKLHPGENTSQIEKRVETYKKMQEAQLEEYVQNNKIPITTKENGKDKIIYMPKDKGDIAFDKIVNESFDKMIKEEVSEKTRCLNEKLPLKIERAEYYRKNGKEVNDLVKKIATTLEQSKDPKEIKSTIENIIKDLKINKKDKELINIIQEISDYGLGKSDGCVSSVETKVSNVLKDIDMYSKLPSKEAIEKEVKNNITKRVAEIDENIKFIEELKTSFKEGKNIKQIEMMISKRINSLKASNKGVDRLTNLNITQKIVELYKSKIKGNIDAYKRITSLVVAFAMLPVTCTLLNWVYPRLMDIMFPNLSNKKHTKVSTELVNKACKKSEVK